MENDLPIDHPRYESLKHRHLIVDGMKKNLLNIVEGDYVRDGFTIIDSHEIGLKINTLTKEFKKFKNTSA